jgi:hypothetical protein
MSRLFLSRNIEVSTRTEAHPAWMGRGGGRHGLLLLLDGWGANGVADAYCRCTRSPRSSA